MNDRLARFLSAARQVGLTVGAVAGVLCLLVAIAAVALGVRPLVFRSGSMSPTIGTGALAIAHRVDASSLRVGDVVSVPTTSGTRVTHRIQEVRMDGDQAVLVLKGDGSRAADPHPYVVAHADRVIFSVPWLGYAVAWLTGPVGLFLLGVYAMFLLSVIIRPGGGPGGPREGDPPPRAGPGRHRAVAASALAVVTGVGLVSGMAAQARGTTTLAAWVDSGTVSGTSQTAYTVPSPVLTCAANVPASTTNTQHVTYTWPGVTSPGTTYAVAVTGLDSTMTSTISGAGTGSVSADIAYDSSKAPNHNKTVTVTVSTRLTATASWTGPSALGVFQTDNASKVAAACGDFDDPTNLAFAAPDGTTRTVAAAKAFATATCGSTSVVMCGTYRDASPRTVQFTLKRVGTTTKCWSNGNWANLPGSGLCPVQTGTTSTQAGTAQTWSVAGNQANMFPTTGGAGAFTLVLTITDVTGNASTATLTFTMT